MTFALALRRILPALLAVLLVGVPARVSAEIVWNPQTGWSLEGGSLSGLAGPEARNALELMNNARRAEDRGSAGSAIGSYSKVAKKYPNSIYAPEALFRAAHLRLGRKEYFKAFEAFQSLISRYPNTRRFNEIIGEQYRIAARLLDGARNHYWGIIPGFTARSKGIEYFEILLVDAPYSDYAPLALMSIARAHQRLGNIEEAIDALDRLINNYPQSLLAPDAYLNIAKEHASLVQGPEYDQGSTKESITYFEDFLILFPSDADVPESEAGLNRMKTMLAESKMKMGDFYFYKRDNYTAARVFYNEAITAFPDSDVARRAKVRLTQVEAKAAGKPVPGESHKKKRFWLF
ncbi:outer membrane protein assembly factor BamD [Horticoccus luteus]|uniref:Outer membrane protein assembly factor BamD n=1 Tax=Horticoccus luteus TaxID=2862869 RepID=A0A8F9TW29_9BACT|nr:outer membrane protein assembly factor BamD [Horticoccus luteus]QYM80176.1 outer membrane protein assembly factor BamD [Horticoccus luteus]